jgi:2-methylaconitate cis-trans-isomerase PrpF
MAKIAKNTNKLNPVQLQGKLDVSLTAVEAEPTTFTGAAALLTTGEERSDELEAANQKVANLTAQLAQARE